jgi:hypothetical protein
MAVSIIANDSYVFSYHAWTTVAATVPVEAIEGAVTSKTAEVNALDYATTSIQAFVYPFVTDAGRDANGVDLFIANAFDAGPGDQICFSNVSLVDTSVSH